MFRVDIKAIGLEEAADLVNRAQDIAMPDAIGLQVEMANAAFEELTGPDSPKFSGLQRRSWMLSVDQPSEAELPKPTHIPDSIPLDVGAQRAGLKGYGPNHKIPRRIFLTTKLPYPPILNFGAYPGYIMRLINRGIQRAARTYRVVP